MIFITYDTDHMTEARMESFLSTFRIPGEATFFCTERFGSLESKDNDRHEIGLHPFLDDQTDWMAVVTALRGQWPRSKSIRGVRAHSCTYSQRFGVNLSKAGFEYVSHVTVPISAPLQPYMYPWGIIEVPIHYMDNMDFTQVEVYPDHTPFDLNFIQDAVSSPLAFIFDFHPIHLLINSTSAAEYAVWWELGCPHDYCCEGRGVRDFYNDLVDIMIASGRQSQGLSKLLSTARLS